MGDSSFEGLTFTVSLIHLYTIYISMKMKIRHIQTKINKYFLIEILKTHRITAVPNFKPSLNYLLKSELSSC